MLRFITGTAGVGKTTRLAGEIEIVARAGGKAILLVPEQLSFESEKYLYRTLGSALSLQVEVLGFTRLCNSIFRALGGLADPPVTPAAKLLLMSVAVGELRDRLTVYRKSLANTAFLQTLVETCAEFKTAGVRPRRLSGAAGECEGPLADKLAELADIYAAYQALLEQGYSDSDDDVIRACALLENADFFGEYTVFVDGFTTFMAAEFELLGHAVAQARDIWFCLTCDELADRQRGMGVFSPVREAAARLSRIAAERGVAVAPPVLLAGNHRFQSAALRHIGRYFFQPGAPAYTGNVSGVSLFRATDRYNEIEYVAAAITRLVRERGYRYRDIAVIARDVSPYQRALEQIFTRYEIPWFADIPRDAENHPLVSGLLHAVDAVRSGFDAEAVLLAAKSPLMGLAAEPVAQLENYVYCWGVRGAAWISDFTASPRGLAGPLSDDDRALLSGVNATRAAVVGPLAALREALAFRTGRRFAEGLYEFLQMAGAAENLTNWAAALDPDERNTFLSESAQIWDVVIGVLDVFGSILGSIQMQRARLCELLRVALSAAEIGLPPQTLDQVLVGGADRIRPVSLRAVFVVGAVEGVFPAQIGSTGVFTDAERRRMHEVGVEIAAPTLQKSVLEKYFAYYALTLASERLSVSWPRSGLDGQEQLPSVIVSQLKALLPGVAPQGPDPLLLVQNEGSALAQLSREYGRDTPLAGALWAHFAGSGRGELLARLTRARTRPPHRIADRAAARELFGRRLRLSPTRVERFYRCPFSYFAADGLALKRRARVEFTPIEAGSVIHNVLQVMVQRHGGRALAGLPEEVMRAEIDEIIRDFLTDRVENIERLPTRFRYLFTRLTGMLARLLRHIGEEFAQSEFEPAAFELPISQREGVEPLRLETVDGVPVLVEGVVDRVDILHKNGKRYVRVVDYKSGAKQFALNDVLYGLNMQMLIYLFTIGENGGGELADAIPAGVLYMPVRERFISAARDDPDAKIAAEHRKQWRMSGLLLEDEEVLRGMERDLAGVFIPAKLGKNGFDARSSLATRAELGALSRKVQELVVKMAESLSEGEIGAVPTISDDYKTCEYCDFRAVCGFEPGDPIREIAKLDRAAALEMLRKEEADG